MISDLRRETSTQLFTCKTASQAIASRVGLCKHLHLDTGVLWIQHHVNRKNTKRQKVTGFENKADVGTKDMQADAVQKIMTLMNFEEGAGRHQKNKLEVASDAQRQPTAKS